MLLPMMKHGHLANDTPTSRNAIKPRWANLCWLSFLTSRNFYLKDDCQRCTLRDCPGKIGEKGHLSINRSWMLHDDNALKQNIWASVSSWWSTTLEYCCSYHTVLTWPGPTFFNSRELKGAVWMVWKLFKWPWEPLQGTSCRGLSAGVSH